MLWPQEALYNVIIALQIHLDNLEHLSIHPSIHPTPSILSMNGWVNEGRKREQMKEERRKEGGRGLDGRTDGWMNGWMN